MTGRLEGFRPSVATGLIRTLSLGVAAIAIAAGLYLLFGIVRDWQQQDRGQRTLSAAQDLEVTTTARYLELRERFKAAVDDAYLRADADARAFAAAEARFAASFPGMRELTVLPPDLDSAFAGELGDFGYGRLWLAVRALGEGGPVSGAVASAGGTALGLAQKLSDEVGTVGVVVAELPAEAVAQTVGADPRWSRGLPVGLYLAEAQVAGAAIASAQASRIPIGDSGLEIRYTEPNAATAVPMGRLLASLLALVLGAWLLLRIFRASGQRLADADGPTLAESVAANWTPKTVPVKPKVAPETALPGTLDVSREIFRAYDIRGVVGKTLDEDVAKLIGRAIGSEIRSQGLSDVVVGRDGRLSGPEMLDALTRGLRESGCDVIDVGLVPTPVVYFGVTHLNAGSGVAVTGSHNPPDYNGFKVVIGGVTLAGSAIQDLYRRIAESDFESGHGNYAQRDVLPDYVDRIANDVQAERRLKVVVDCGNGAASEVGPQVLEAIGCDVTTLYCEIDGNFPNHHPDPSQPENLRDLATTVQRLDADLGIAFDGDGDRLGVINRAGEIIYPDRLLMLFAQDVLYRNPGASIIYDVKCTGHLSPWILRHGGSPLMWKTGHSLIKAKMRETDAELAGEMSGHFFFRERWFGFDDGIYAAARLLEILAGSRQSPDEIFAGLPSGASTPELNIKMNEGEPQRIVERFRETTEFEGAKVTTIDGVRVDWPDGFGLVRCSNTTPCLVLRFDADDGDALARIQAEFRDRLTAVAPELELPF